MGHGGGGLVVSVIVFYSNDPGSNPAEVYSDQWSFPLRWVFSVSDSRFPASNLINFFSVPRLKNVDRSSATYHSVTVNDFTVVITEFKPKVKKEKKTKTSSMAASIPALDEDSSRDQYYKNFIVVLTASPIPVSMLDFEA